MARDLGRGRDAGRARRGRGRGAADRRASGRSCSRRAARRRAGGARRSRRGARELGVMLPYSPLHHLLLADAGVPLVMTSGNVSDEPIAYRDDDALERLAGIADLFLVHDRPIHMRTDDSVVRAVRRAPAAAARARAATCPSALALPLAGGAPLLACGAELKSTFCVAKGARAWVGHHIGDLAQLRRRCAPSREGVAHFERLFAVAPGGRRARPAPGLPLDPLRARARGRRARRRPAPPRAPRGVPGRARRDAGRRSARSSTAPATAPTARCGAASCWSATCAGFERAGHLWPVAPARRRPRGARAVADGVRVAGRGRAPTPAAAAPGRRAGDAGARWPRWRAPALAAPLTTSMGRLFDAVAALCGMRARSRYEGQAAIELEARRDRAERGAYPLRRRRRPSLDARADDRRRRRRRRRPASTPVVSPRASTAPSRAATAQACARAAAARGLDTVVLSGGVFQNRLLLERTAPLLEARACGCSCPSGCRRTTAASPTARPRWPRRGCGADPADAVTNARNSSTSARGGPAAARITCQSRGAGRRVDRR